MNILDKLLKEYEDKKVEHESDIFNNESDKNPTSEIGFEDDSYEDSYDESEEPNDAYEDQLEYEEMLDKQEEYEKTLVRYDDTSPYRLFKHSFMHPGYLDCREVVCNDRTYNLKQVADKMVEEAYIVAGRNNARKLNQLKFCNIWYSMMHYVYSGYILTPKGMIEPDTFKSNIIKVLGLMETETANLDNLADHLYKTYIALYSKDAYDTENMIPFKNGDLELDVKNKRFTFYKGRLSPVPYRFGYEFKNIPNDCAEPPFPNFKMWRDELFEEEDVYSLKQMLGYLLLPLNRAQKAFFVIGKARTGKSILTDCIIPTMLGDAMFPISIGQFFNDKFQVGTSEGKLCMVDDDIGEAKLSYEDSGRFKNFVSAETIKIEHKHCNPVKINNSARIVCSGNHMIKSDDKTDGFTRRLHPIYVKSRTIEDEDVYLPDKIAAEIEMIVLWALEGLLEILNNRYKPYVSYRTTSKMVYYAESQKWEEQFITDCFEYKKDSVVYSQDVRSALVEWLKDNSEIAGEGTVAKKFGDVSKWLKDEGTDKYGYTYKRGIKNGDKYNARGYINMSLKPQDVKPIAFTDEHGHLKIRVGKRKTDLENNE